MAFEGILQQAVGILIWGHTLILSSCFSWLPRLRRFLWSFHHGSSPMKAVTQRLATPPCAQQIWVRARGQSWEWGPLFNEKTYFKPWDEINVKLVSSSIFFVILQYFFVKIRKNLQNGLVQQMWIPTGASRPGVLFMVHISRHSWNWMDKHKPTYISHLTLDIFWNSENVQGRSDGFK